LALLEEVGGSGSNLRDDAGNALDTRTAAEATTGGASGWLADVAAGAGAFPVATAGATGTVLAVVDVAAGAVAVVGLGLFASAGSGARGKVVDGNVATGGFALGAGGAGELVAAGSAAGTGAGLLAVARALSLASMSAAAACMRFRARIASKSRRIADGFCTGFSFHVFASATGGDSVAMMYAERAGKESLRAFASSLVCS
jgi:hypothetical protein